ncbi:potassium channel subfamily K member 1-like [Battus philenor]|uniref:potassium channel subfamily K member 1-like n=1 Tax=Battus philenor TaxID=42288 RepID=UPI0035D0C2B8
MLENPKYTRVQSYGSMSSSRSEDDMTVHSQLFPYPKKMVVEREILYEEEHPPFQPLFATTRIFGKARFTCLMALFLCFYVLYMVAGAIVFSSLETPFENDIRLGVIRAKQDFMARYPNIVDDDLEALLEEVIKANNRGVSASRNVTSGPNWSFGQSLFFSSTVVTTIGYGHVTPLSKPGKLFCMAYALLGIPLTLVLLSALVERLLLPATALLRALNAALGHLYRPFTIRLVHLAIIVTTFVVFFILVPAALFAAMEPEWDFLDSLYYCFISLTTIGLGDYIPGDSPDQPYRPFYKVATTLYLITGLTFLMLTLTVFYDIPQLNLSTVFSSMKLDEDPEKMRLSGSTGPGYGVGGLVMRDHYDQRRSVVHIRPHQDDSPSPEDTTPVHARDIRLH